MRIVKIIKEEYYHIFIRGNNKQVIFRDDRDRVRLLFLILHSQSPLSFTNIGQRISPYIKHSVFNVREDTKNELLKSRFVELINFAFMPNHFHLTVFNKKTDGISQYMQKVLNAYTKYYNTKYKTTGHLFEGPYQYQHIRDDKQLSFVSAYVHRNPRELKKWKGKEHTYPWSSFQDYIKGNRWGKLLQDEIIMQKFESGKDYKSFVAKSGAKAHLGENMLID